jgi:ubiquitin carboxyl-terminal hydrolase L3
MSEDSSREEYSGSGDKEPVVWFRQTIGNSCGLMALLHAATNGAARDYIGMAFLEITSC